MKKLILTFVAVMLTLVSVKAQSSLTTNESQKTEAEAIIKRFMGDDSPLTVNVSISLTSDNGKDKFNYTLSGNTLNIEASSGVAACRGFYDFVKTNGAGICSWTANRFDGEKALAATTTSRQLTSPYRDHQYLNVVTYGYSMPYWNEARWDKELDWMALHGIDMPLMLLASESIYREVFKEEGVSEDDLNKWEVGPAHLPWMRMGNLAGNSFDGPLGQPWHDSQKRIAHHILKRMAKLGMKPVVPAFGGFVPKACAEKLGAGNYSATGWNWVPQTYRNYRITPAVPEFKKIGKRFIELWDKEFESSYGTFKYYLSDSFNEMDVPGDLDVLRNYGDQIYQAIIEGSQNPEAVWVTQGWEFVYGSGKWTNGATTSSKYKALTQDCAPHQFMSLYMAPE
ncbi:MAG: alpha-N-acetylglucosaminidase N-terminal domain-containing protein, partial [Bacteroidales bacterium]|nr:alpha-N-acetylglucosaminidase N-terminal domain-containing protein [Candidatus Physcousia equi]